MKGNTEAEGFEDCIKEPIKHTNTEEQIHESTFPKEIPGILKPPNILLDLSKYPKTETNPKKNFKNINNCAEYNHMYIQVDEKLERTRSVTTFINEEYLKLLPDRSFIYSPEVVAISLALDVRDKPNKLSYSQILNQHSQPSNTKSLLITELPKNRHNFQKQNHLSLWDTQLY